MNTLAPCFFHQPKDPVLGRELVVLEDVEEGEVPSADPGWVGMGFRLGRFFWHILIIYDICIIYIVLVVSLNLCWFYMVL